MGSCYVTSGNSDMATSSVNYRSSGNEEIIHFIFKEKAKIFGRLAEQVCLVSLSSWRKEFIFATLFCCAFCPTRADEIQSLQKLDVNLYTLQIFAYIYKMIFYVRYKHFYI